MGNYISIIIGCVGAVELITFLHQLTLRADEEHDQELGRERGIASPPGTRQSSPLAIEAAPPIMTDEPPVEQPQKPVITDEELVIQRKETSTVDAAPSPVRNNPPSRGPEIRFEHYERSCSLSDVVERPLVDGLKLQRPLVRDDGSGRRKVIKKRNSSGSIDFKSSREEELRMFTSLEEEEFSSFSESGYKPISYGSSNAGSSSSIVVHPKRHRRFKRSPVKNSDTFEDNSSSSREAVDDVPLLEDPMDTTVTFPWGDLKPVKHRRHLGHEKSMSIEELQEDEERTDEVITNDALVAAMVARENVSTVLK